MEYEEFKEALLGQLKDFYGKDGNVVLGKVKGDDSPEHDGLWIVLTEEEDAAVPVIKMEKLYKDYRKGRLAGIDKCVEAVICPEEQYLYPGMDGRADVLEQKTDTEKGISGYSYFEDGDEGEARRYK